MSQALPLNLELGFEDDAPGFDSRAGTSAAERTMPQVASAGPPQTPVDTVHESLIAAEVLARFEAHRPRWFERLAQESEGIARVLREEARVSTQLGGLPGTDYRGLWDTQSRDSAASAPKRLDTAAEWHPPLWALAPVIREHGGTLRLRLPRAAAPEVVAKAVLEHCPPAWRKRESVRVRLEIETRIYWGARSPDDASPWQPCSLRGDGVGLAEPLLQIDRGTPRWLQPPAEATAPTILRTLRPGVGLLVVVPVVVYERLPRPLGLLARFAQRVLNWIDRLRGARRDRDPTFASRLTADEAYWATALHTRAATARQLKQSVRSGALLAAASPPAIGYSPRAVGDAPGPTHVVLVHGGLSSARNAFDAWLAEQPQQAPLWRGLDVLETAHVWRFEHDSFLRLDENIGALAERLERQIVGKAVRGRIVFITHSRGGAVVRFALPQLRDRWPGWDFHALTAGAPHDGTPVFTQVGQRWVGVAGVVGLVGSAVHGLLDRDEMAKLKNLERGMAGDIPPGFQDLSPEAVRKRANGRPLPAQIVAWGSQWRAGVAEDWSRTLWRHVIEDFGGLEAEGDGLIPLNSAMMGLRTYNASPVSHVEYFHHQPTIQQIREHLLDLLKP